MSSDEEFINNCKYAITATRIEGESLVFYHMALYEQEPTKHDLKGLKEELKTDEEFGLTDIADELTYTIITEKVLVDYFKEKTIGK